MEAIYNPAAERAEAVAKATQGGGGAVTLPIPTLAARGTVLRLNVPDYLATSWRVTLAHPKITGVLTPPMSGTWPLQLVTTPAVNWTRLTTFAIVRWGVGSTRHEAYVDWREGQTFIVHGSWVEVDVQTGPIVALLPAAGQEITFQAQIVEAHASQIQPGGEGPTISQVGPTMAVGTTSEYVVPPYARRLRLHSFQGLTLDNMVVRFFPTTAAADLLSIYTFSASSARSVAAWDPVVPVPVPAQAAIMQITNAVAPDKAVIVEWLLDLG